MFRDVTFEEAEFVSGGDASINGCPVVFLPTSGGTLLEIDFDLGIGSDFPPSTTDPFGGGEGGEGIPGDYVGTILGTQFSNPSDLAELQDAVSQVIDPLADLVDQLTLNDGTPNERTVNGVGVTLSGGESVFVYADSNTVVIQGAIELN